MGQAEMQAPKSPAALGTLLSSGKNSEIWTGAILASGGINEVGVNAVLERENAYSWAIDYMNSMYRIDNDVLLEMDPTYTGDATDLMLDKYKDIRNMFCRTLVTHIVAQSSILQMDLIPHRIKMIPGKTWH